MNLLTLQFQAKDPLLKIARSYTIWLGQDLFGDWILTTVHGGLGRKGRTRSYAYSSQENACQKLKTILKRRASAPRRIGCVYKLIHCEMDQKSFKDSMTLTSLEQLYFS